MLKASDLVAFAKSMVGMPYWYGTCVYKCTNSLFESKSAQYPSHYKASRKFTYKKHISEKLVCMDCVGLIKGFFWTNGGVGVVDSIGNDKTFSRKYAGNGMPDKSANGLLSWCKSKGAKNGTIDTIPDVGGIAVFSEGHVGVYIGKGEVVEARGFNYGVVTTELNQRNWTHWSFLPSSILNYEGKDGVEIVPKVYTLGERVLMLKTPRMEGNDVSILQTMLNSIGFSCGEVDGIFGLNTHAAVTSFQNRVLIDVDGKVGKETISAIKRYNPKASESSETIRALFRRFCDDVSKLESYQKLKQELGE